MPAEYAIEILSIKRNDGENYFTEVDLLFLSQSKVEPGYVRGILAKLDPGLSGHVPYYDLNSLHDSGVPLEYAQRLLSIASPNGNHFFSIYDVGYLFDKKVPAEYVESLLPSISLLEKNAGTTLSAYTLFEFYQSKVDKDYIEIVAGLNGPNHSVLGIYDICNLSDAQIPIQTIREISAISKKGIKFDADDIKDYNRIVHDPDYAQRLAGICGQDGIPIFSAWDINHYCLFGGTPDDAAQLCGFKAADGKPLFGEYEMMMLCARNYYHRTKKEEIEGADPITYVFYHLAQNLIGNGSGEDSIEEIASLLSLRSKGGAPLFDSRQVFAFTSYGGRIDYAKEIMDKAGNNDAGAWILKCKELGLSPEDAVQFHDTAKPNALVIFGACDPLGVLDSREAIEVFKQVISGYDARIFAASENSQAYDSFSEAGAYDLALIVGHGSREGISLGMPKETADPLQHDPKYSLNSSDARLEESISRLRPDATIMLYSCGTAGGGMFSDNFANKVASFAGTRRVIASREPFGASDIHIKSVYPLDLSISDEERGDFTYIISKDKADIVRTAYAHAASIFYSLVRGNRDE